METHKERVFDILQQNITFSHDVFHFIPLDDCLLLKYFDGIALSCLLVSAKIHLQTKAYMEGHTHQ